MAQSSNPSKLNLYIGIIASIQIVCILAGVGYVYFFHSQIEYLGRHTGNDNYFNELKIDEINRKINTLSADKSTVKNTLSEGNQIGNALDFSSNYRKQKLFNSMLSDYYLEKNSLVTNGALRVRLLDQLFFSVDIPKETYQEFSLVSYSGGNQTDSHKDVSQTFDTLTLDQGKVSSPSENISMYFTWDYYSFGKDDVTCEGTSDETNQIAARIFHKVLNLSFENLDIEEEKFDWCKYIIPQKNVPGIVTSYFMRNPPTLSNYTLSTDPESLTVAYTLDTKRLYEDLNKKRKDSYYLYNPRRYYIAFTHPKNDNSGLVYRLVTLDWWSGIRNDEPDEKTLKQMTERAHQVLLPLEKSLTEKTIVAPLCEYGCSY